MALIKLLLDICLFRKGPQDIPYSILLLSLTVLWNITVSVALGLIDMGVVQALMQSLLGLSLLLLFLVALLKLMQKRARFVQTLTAALASDALISSIAIFALTLGQSLTGQSAFLGFLLVFLMMWQIAVLGHILRHALSTRFLLGLALSFSYTLVVYRVMMSVMPNPV